MDCVSNSTGYDLASNLIKTTYPNGAAIEYRYDNASRLKSIIDSKPDGTLNAIFNYTLDSLGSRTAIASHQPLNATPSWPNTNYTHDNDNRLLTAGSTTFNYDNNGNLITKTLGSNVTNYTWDFNDMLTQVTSGGNTYVYRYDGLGNRVARIENSVEKRYVGGLAETDASGNITAYYVYGLGLISKITPTNQSYFYHFDGIASTIGISDSSGNMVNKYAYDAFGKILNQEEGIPNPFKYVGGFGVMDEGNGLFYMRARFYDPEVGRFINKDPIGFAGGDFNLYAYVQNDPINFIDPLGLARVDWWKTYIQFAFSSSILFEGTTRSDEGIEQQTENYVNVIGGSLDIYIGSPPSPCYTTYEIGVGFSHLGIGYFFGNPDGSGNYQSWGVALHVGPAFSLFPAYINVTHPIRWLKIPMGPTYLGKAK